MKVFVLSYRMTDCRILLEEICTDIGKYHHIHRSRRQDGLPQTNMLVSRVDLVDTTYLFFFLRPFVVCFSLLITSFQSVFWSSLYFLLTLLFARYSPFYLCLF